MEKSSKNNGKNLNVFEKISKFENRTILIPVDKKNEKLTFLDYEDFDEKFDNILTNKKNFYNLSSNTLSNNTG